MTSSNTARAADAPALFGDTPLPSFAYAEAFLSPEDAAEYRNYIPDTDTDYLFDARVLQAALLSFARNKRMLLTGPHGSGKSTHIEQIAARLGRPCVRLNLDGQITRADLIGKDTITVEDGKQAVRFADGFIPWCLRRPVTLILDEYDAAPPDAQFVLQRLLEENGRFALTDTGEIIRPHPQFRLFATANTAGRGDATGLYHGVYLLNQGHMDRWTPVCELHYPDKEKETALLRKKNPDVSEARASAFAATAELIRRGFAAGDIGAPISTRTLLQWAEISGVINDDEEALYLCYGSRCDEEERRTLAEYVQRCFGGSKEAA